MPKSPIDPSPSTSRRSFLTKVGLGLAAASLPNSVRASQKNHLITSFSSMNNSDKIFIPVMLTTYHQDGTIDYDGMSRLMDFYLAAGAKGFFANCLSSEMYLLTDEEKLKLTKYQLIHSNPRYGTNAAGILMPASCWLFSKMEATIRGRANALPFSVWARTVFLSSSLNRSLRRVA